MVLCNEDCIPCCNYCAYVIYECDDYHGQEDLGVPVGCIKHIRFEKCVKDCNDFHCINANEGDMDMSVIKLAMTCPVCEEVIIQDGWCMDSTIPDKVVNLDMFAYQHFECENCGTNVYTGDVDSMYEYEEGHFDQCDEEYDNG